jgi:phage-related protein
MGIRTAADAALGAIIPRVQELIGPIGALVTALQQAGPNSAAAMAALTSLLGAQTVDVIRLAWEQLTLFFGPMAARIQAALAGLSGELAPLGAKFAALGAAAQPVFEMLATVVGATVAILTNLLGNTLAAVLDNAALIIGGLLDAATASFTMFGDLVTNVIGVVQAVLAGDWAAAWTGAQRTVTTFGGELGPLLAWLLTATSKAHASTETTVQASPSGAWFY